jgi:hypothetical protein
MEWNTPIHTLLKCIPSNSAYLTGTNVHNYSAGLYQHRNVLNHNVSEVGSTGILLCIRTVQTLPDTVFLATLLLMTHVQAKCKLIFKMVKK